MSILVDTNTNVVIQGITGKEGARASKSMISYGTKVLAGVTPGKGGTVTEDGVPVFHTMREALAAFPEINTSLIAVPPAFTLDAALEAIHHRVQLIDILTEKVPVAQVAKIIALSRSCSVRVVGPSSVGILTPGEGKIGSIGSSELVNTIFMQGPVGVISKSGGMTAELSRILTTAGLGQSTVVGIGGDVLIGSDFLDIALEFEKDERTSALVIFGEVGGVYEEKLAEAVEQGIITKPVVALIAGRFTEMLPQETALGHAGAIVNKGRGSAASKISALSKAGALIANTPEEIPALVKRAIDHEHISHNKKDNGV
ncbi:MAG: succinate--CoA ligase subunit alpha [Candidatus Wildermuthbacteria bacterium]|nr:succinate--CoA ligase subunit alpha [Candidatus Wildermuthbacteria bacterium]